VLFLSAEEVWLGIAYVSRGVSVDAEGVALRAGTGGGGDILGRHVRIMPAPAYALRAAVLQG
jgi:hypothetical protein